MLPKRCYVIAFSIVEANAVIFRIQKGVSNKPLCPRPRHYAAAYSLRCVLHVRAAISVELSEVLDVSEATVYGEFETWNPSFVETHVNGVDPIDNDCSGLTCVGSFTRVRDMASRRELMGHC